MNDLSPDGKGLGAGSPNEGRPGCCQPEEGQGTSCCNPQGGSWGTGKALLAALIILAAIGVGAVSFMRGNAAQPGASTAASSCPAPGDAASCTTPAHPGSSPAQSSCCPVSKPGKAGP